MEESDLDLLDFCHSISLGTTSRILGVVILLFMGVQRNEY